MQLAYKHNRYIPDMLMRGLDESSYTLADPWNQSKWNEATGSWKREIAYMICARTVTWPVVVTDRRQRLMVCLPIFFRNSGASPAASCWRTLSGTSVMLTNRPPWISTSTILFKVGAELPFHCWILNENWEPFDTTRPNPCSPLYCRIFPRFIACLSSSASHLVKNSVWERSVCFTKAARSLHRSQSVP